MKAAAALAAGNNGAASDGEDDDMDMDDDEYQPVPSKLSNRRKKEQSRLTVAQLKQLVACCTHPYKRIPGNELIQDTYIYSTCLI